MCVILSRKSFLWTKHPDQGTVITEAAIGGVLSKKVFLQENTCARASCLINLQALIKKGTPAQVFSCEFLRTPFFVEHLRWLLLNVGIYQKYGSRKTQLNCYQVRKRVTLVKRRLCLRLSKAFESPSLQPQPLYRYLGGLSKIQSFLKGNAIISLNSVKDVFFRARFHETRSKLKPV